MPGRHAVQGVNVSGDEQADLLEICQPRQPCFKLGLHLDDPLMVKRFAQASRPGAYLRIIESGQLTAGDTVDVLDVPGHGVTIRLVADAVLLDHDLAAQAARAPQLPGALREWLLSAARRPRG